MNEMTRKSFLTAAAAFGAVGCSRAFAVSSGSASREKPNLRFGLLSDLHIQCVTGDRGYGGGPENFAKALVYFRDRGADAVVIAGDMSDLGLGDELMLVAKTWFGVFPDDRAPDGRKVERIFITGNHESCVFSGNGNLSRIRRLYGNDEGEVRRQLLRLDFAGWWERAFRERYERFYHREVKGYHFLSAQWDDGHPLPDRPLDDFGWIKGKINAGCETFGVELGTWLRENGGRLDPKRPFFYQQHRALWKSNYADWAWNHDRGLATQELSRFANAVAFAGDTHYSLTDERSIWQGAFTSVGTGSLRYTGLPYDSRRPRGYENTQGPDKCQGAYDPCGSPQGQFVSVYDDRIVFERRDFAADRSLGEDWVVPLNEGEPKTYSFAERAKSHEAPQFAPGAKLSVTSETAPNHATPPVRKNCLCVTIPPVAAKPQARGFEYEVDFIGAAGARKTFRVLAEGFNKPFGHARTLQPTICRVATDLLPPDVARVEVTPLNCFWQRGRTLCAGRRHQA